MVEPSDHGDLPTTFLSLPFPRMFMYGEQNATLSYLPALAAGGVELIAIPHSGHWPMYAKPRRDVGPHRRLPHPTGE